MNTSFELQAELRANIGKGASRRLRRANKIPAIIYGAEKTPLTVTLNHFHVHKALKNEAFYSHILTLHIDGEKQQAVLKDVQRHPYKPQILHMDFLRVNPKEKIIMHIPLHFIGAETAAATKQGGIVTHMLNSVEVRCLPADLPEFINVDISQLALDATLHLSQLILPPGVELMAFVHHGEAMTEHDAGVVKIHIPRAAVEEPAATAPVVAAAPAAAAPPAAKDKKDRKDKK